MPTTSFASAMMLTFFAIIANATEGERNKSGFLPLRICKLIPNVFKEEAPLHFHFHHAMHAQDTVGCK